MTGLEHHLGEDLGAMADGGRGLSAERHAALRAHVEGCGDCRRALEQARLVLETVARELVPPTPAQAFDARLFQRLDAIDRERTTEARAASPMAAWFARFGGWLRPARVGLLAGAAAAATAWVVSRRPATSGGPGEDGLGAPAYADLGAGGEALALAEDLDLYEDFELMDQLEVLEELDLIADLEVKPG